MVATPTMGSGGIGLDMKKTTSVRADARTIIGLLAKNEAALGQLYQAYAVALPAMKDLWVKLTVDEQHHAQWLEALALQAAVADPPVPCCWPRQAAVESSLEYINRETLRARQPGLTAVAALSIAKDLEDALLEKQFFRAAEGVSPNVKAVFGRLIAATEKHRQVVLDALAKAKASLPEAV
jgi:hypothetical protein